MCMSRKMWLSLQRDVQVVITRFPSFMSSFGVGLEHNGMEPINGMKNLHVQIIEMKTVQSLQITTF